MFLRFGVLGLIGSRVCPKALRTHVFRLLGPKTILYKAFGLFFEP